MTVPTAIAPVASNSHSEVVTPSGMVLGLRLPGATERFADVLEEHTRPLAPGDVIVLYTDGITEAMDESGELFSDEALARVVSSQHRLDAGGIRERVIREVRAFVGNAEPRDQHQVVSFDSGGFGCRKRYELYTEGRGTPSARRETVGRVEDVLRDRKTGSQSRWKRDDKDAFNWR